MNPNRSNRRVHSADFKAQVLGDCKQPSASVAAVAVAHGLNPNVVRKWLAGQNLKRMGAVATAPAPASAPTSNAPLLPALQFVPVELAKSELPQPSIPAAQPDIRINLERGGLQLTLQCASSAGPAYAALLRALADTMAVG